MSSRSRAVLLLAAATLAATACPSPRFARSSPETQPAAAAAAGAAPTAADAPATQPAAATQPSATTRPSADIRLNFKNTPLDALLEHLSQVAGLTIIKEAPIEGRVTLMSMQPVTAQEAVTVLNPVLKGNGLTAIQDGRTLRIVSSTKAKKGNLPVHYGADPAEIAATDELITQVIPVHNVEATKLRQDLTPLIGIDADVTANAGANAIIMTDTSANIRRIVEVISILDRREGTTSEVKIIQLKNASATAAARMVLQIFKVEEPPPPKDQPRPRQPEGRLLGTGVDQALHGGKVTASADERTNSVVVAAPADTLKAIENMLREIDDNPATAATPGIRSFHLKVADAAAVGKALSAIFQTEGEKSAQAGQSHQMLSEQPLHARVTVVAEPRTNTLLVTAPPAAMTVVEGIIKDLESSPEAQSTVRSFHLKFADATSTAKVLLSVFIDPSSGQSRLQSAKEKVGITADARTNSVIVTAPSEAFPLVEETIRDLDANPTAGARVKFYHLRQADAVATAKIITTFFKPPEGAGAEQKKIADAVHVGVNAVADDRTNTVAVTAPDESIKVIDDIVRELENDPSTAYDIQSFTLKYADATAAAKLVTSVFQPDQQQAANNGSKAQGKEAAVKAKVVAAADDRTNTVIVTAPSETLKIIDGIMKLLDANPAAGANMQVFTLQNADAGNAARLLDSMFQPPSPQASGGANAKPPGAAEAIRRLGWVQTSADDRTNTLVVTAPADTMKLVSSIVQRLDSNPTSQETFFIYRLRNGQAQSLAFVLNQLFGNLQPGGQLGIPGAQGRLGTTPGAQQPQPLSGLAALTGGQGLGSSLSGVGGTGIGARRTGTTGTLGGPGSLLGRAGALSPLMARAITELTGQVFVVADPDTNSLLVTTATKYQKQVRDIIAELDRPVPQVLIKVLVAEVTHDNSADMGVDFSVLNKRANGNGTSAGVNLGNAAAAAANGGLVVSLMETNVTATLHALSTEGKLDVLSRPYILASDNQLASITVGQEVPFITNTRVTELGQTLNTIQYQDVGIILNVTPHINPEGLVIMDVTPEISQLTGTTVPIGDGVAAPVIAKRSAQSRVGISNGQTIVIGGLMEDRKTLTVNKVPILGDLPLIGPAFSRTETEKTKTELLIFLTPHVAAQPDLLKPMSQDEMNGTKLTPGAVAPGTFAEHMRGMERGTLPDTRPATEPSSPVLEIGPATTPTTQPTEMIGPTTTGPIRLPFP